MPNPYEAMGVKPQTETETNPYESMATKPSQKESNPYKSMALENKGDESSRLTNYEYNNAKENKRGAVASFVSGGVQGFAEYGSSINKALGMEQGQDFWEHLKAKEQVKTEDHPWAKLGGEIILDPINLIPMGVASKVSKVSKITNAIKTGTKAATKSRNLIAKNLKAARKNGTATNLAYMAETKGSKANRIIRSVATGTAIGAGTQAFKNYGDTTKTGDEKIGEIGVSAGIVGVLNGVIAGLSKGKITNAIKSVDDLTSDDAIKGVDAIIANPEQFGLSAKQVDEVKAIKENYHTVDQKYKVEVTRPKLTESNPTLPDWIPGRVNNPPIPYDPMTKVKSDNPILTHPRMEELMKMREGISAKDSNYDQVQYAPRHIKTNIGDYPTISPAINTKNYNADFVLTKQDISNIKSGKIDDTLTAKIEQDLGRLDNDPQWKKKTDSTAEDSTVLQKQADEMHAEHLAEQEGKPEDMSLKDWAEAKTMFANGGGNAFGGAMGGGTLGGADAAYEDIVEGKDLSTEDYLARIAGGAAIGAGFGHKFGGKGEGAGLFAGQKAKGFDSAKNVHSGKYDGQQRFEIDDSGMQLHKPSFQKMSKGQTVKLSEAIDHPEAFKNYPELRDIDVKFDSNMQGNASFDGENTITLSTRLSEEDARSGLVHEMQHAIQSREGFAGGGSYTDMLRQVEGRIYSLEKKGDLSPLDAMHYKDELTALKEDPSKEAFDRYRKVAGEIEAREVQARQGLTPQERELIPAYENTSTMGNGKHSDEAYNSAFIAELEGRHKNFYSTGISPDDATLDFSRSRADHAVALEDDFIRKGRVDIEKVSKSAETLLPPIRDIKDISTHLNKKGLLDTPVGQIKINPEDSFKHLTVNTHGHNRFGFSGGFIPTLKDPLFVIENLYKGKKTAIFYKPFKDEKNDIIHLAGYAIDKNGKLVNTTFFDINPSKLKRYMEVDDDKLLFYKRSGDDPGSLSSHSKRVDNTNAYDGSIPQNPQKPNMRDGFLNMPGIKQTKEYFGNMVEDDTLRDWKDARSTMFNMFRDSLGGEYHKARETVTAATNGMTVKLERLQKMLVDLSEKDRVDMHDFMADEGTELSKELEPIARMIKDDIKTLGQEMVNRKILTQEAYDEWAGRYIHRSYEKHLMQDVKNLMKKGFTVDEIHKRGKRDIISKEEADKLTNNLWTNTPDNPFNKPLKEGGIRLKDNKDGTFEVTRDWTRAEREAMGEVRDGAVTIPDTLMRMQRMIENAKFLENVEGMDAVVLRDFREEAFDLMGNKIEGKARYNKEELKAMGFVEVSNNMKFGALAGKAIRKDVYDDIVAMNDELFNTFHGADGAMGRVWKGYLSTWKKSKTVWNAPSHVNNFLSNIFLMHLNGMSAMEVISAVGKAGKMMYKEKHYEELFLKHMKGQANLEEIAQLSEIGKELKYFLEAKETGLLGRSQLNDILGGQQNAVQKRGILSKMDKFAQDAYQGGDVINRIAMYTHLRSKMGKSPDEARKAVLDLMPDYSKPMPKGYRILRDTGISPFISWSYYTMPAVIKQMGTKTGAKQMAKVVGLLSAMEFLLTDGEVKPWDNLPFVEGSKPESFKGRRFAVGRDGNKIDTIKMNMWIPYLELQDPVNFVMSQIGGPTVKAATNLGTAMSKNGMVDTYSGRGVTNQHKPFSQRAYDTTKYLAQNYVPLPAQAYSVYDFIESMVRDKKKRRKNSVVDPRTTTQSVAKLLGLNTMTFDKSNLKKEQRKK